MAAAKPRGAIDMPIPNGEPFGMARSDESSKRLRLAAKAWVHSSAPSALRTDADPAAKTAARLPRGEARLVRAR